MSNNLVALTLGAAAALALGATVDRISAGSVRFDTRSPAALDFAGVVRSASGTWFLREQGRPLRRLRPGNEVPAGAQLLVVEPERPGRDDRSIRISMFDGTDRFFACADPTTCEEPITLLFSPSDWYADTLTLLASLIYQLTPHDTLTTLIALRGPLPATPGEQTISTAAPANSAVAGASTLVSTEPVKGRQRISVERAAHLLRSCRGLNPTQQRAVVTAISEGRLALPDVP